MARVYKRGKKYYIEYIYHGRKIRKSAGRSKQEAKSVLHDIQDKIIRGELGIEGEAVRFKDFAETYLDFSRVSKAPSSYRRDTYSLRHHLIPFFRKKWLHEIKTWDVHQYQMKRLTEVKGATCNRELACLRHLYNLAIKWGKVNYNPVKGVRFMPEIPRIQYLTIEQINRLLNQCSGMLHSIVMTAVNTGMRKGELMRLKWSDVDLVNRKIRVIGRKTYHVRFIPINNSLFDELVMVPRYGDYVFSKEDGQPYGHWKTSFTTARRNSGLLAYRFHDLRHTFASYLVMSGVDIRTVQALLGHKRIEMTMRYAHLSFENLNIAVKKLDTKLTQKIKIQNQIKPILQVHFNEIPGLISIGYEAKHLTQQEISL